MHPLERDLVDPVAGHLAGRGFDVFGEVAILHRRADLVGIGEEVVAVELKLRAWREALRQATAYQVGADRTFVALPLHAAHPAYRHRWAFEREGIGLLAVDGEDRVRVVIPAARSGRTFPPLRDALRRELRTGL